MKEMIKKVKERREGFTMAELLIVVAIIAVLVAIAIPVFSAQLHKSQDATDQSNARSLYAELQADYLSNANGYTKSTWAVTGASEDSTYTINAGGTFKLSSGDEVKLNNCNVTAKFTADKGWVVTCICSKDDTHVSETWGGTSGA